MISVERSLACLGRIEKLKFLLCLVTLQCVLTAVGYSQDHVQDHGYAGCEKYPFLVFAETGDPWIEDPAPIPSHYRASERLIYAGVPLTEKGLREGLRNSRTEIRYSAAWYLADQNAKEAIPYIFAALGAEQVPRAKAYIACALVELGDKRGVQALHRYCADAKFPASMKHDVTNFLLELHETPCPEAVDTPH